MKVPVWLQVQIERELDHCQPVKIELNYDGGMAFKMQVTRYYNKPPEERPAGMTEY
jgi:hypothetical protein